MLKRTKRASLAAVFAGVLVLAGAANADATTWFDVGTLAQPTGASGSVSMNGTASASRFIITGDSPVYLNCLSTGVVGSVTAGSYTRSIPTPPGIGTLLFTFGSCTGPLGLSFTVTCAHPPSSTTKLHVTASPSGTPATTPVKIGQIHCTIEFPLIGCEALLSGEVLGEYVNATSMTDGELTVFVAGQNLEITDSECPQLIPNEDAHFTYWTDNLDVDFTIDGALNNQPVLTDT